MAIEITNQNVVYDTSDSTVDTEGLSLIKINATSYNVFNSWFDFIRKYFGVDDYNDPYISTLKSSFFGYFNEIASSEIKNAVYHKNFLYDEHFLNTAILPESIYNFAKQYNVPIENSIPASMLVSISVLEEELLNSSFLKEIDKETITNANANTLKVYNLKIDRNTTFSVNNIRFMLPYPLIITVQEMTVEQNGQVMSSYGYTANYDTSANSFPILEDQGIQPYIKIWKENINGQNYLYVGCQIFQMKKNTQNITITTTNNNPQSLYHNILFEDQLAYFEAFYEYNGKIIPLNLYFNNIYTPTEKEYYAYFNYVNDQLLQISFSSNIDGFKPAIGSNLIVNTYTTLGYKGNFDYSGGITMNFVNNNTFSFLNFNCQTLIDGSVDGKDKLDTIGQKIKILEAITTRNNIITDNDLIKYFDSINESLNINGSTIQFLKKQDDVIKRIYCNFLLLRDENRRVIPTNTAPHLRIKKSELEQTKSIGKYVIREHSIVQCNYVRDIVNYNPLLIHNEELIVDDFDNYFDKDDALRYSQNYIKYFVNNEYYQDILNEESELFQEAFNDIDSIYDRMSTEEAEIASDELIYTIPFMLSIEEEPFLKCTYYNVDANAEMAMSYQYLNNKVGASFNISTLKIEKDINPSASNKFTLDSNVYKLSFNLNTNLSYDEIKNKVIVKCLIADKDEENNYGHFFFTLKNVKTNNSNNVVNYDYLYEAELSTDYSFTNGKLNLYNSLYNVEVRSGRSVLYQNASIPEDVVFKIGILYYDPILALNQTINEKKEWKYKFPLGFIQQIEEGNDIMVEELKPLKEYSVWEENIGDPDYGNNGCYIDVQSVFVIPPDVDLTNPTEEFYKEKDDDKHHYGFISYFYNEDIYNDGKLILTIKDTRPLDPQNLSYLKLDGYIKGLIPDFNNDWCVEIGHHIIYDEQNPNRYDNDNIEIIKEISKNGEKTITITIKNFAKISTEDENISYAKLINIKNIEDKGVKYTRETEYIDMSGNLGYQVIKSIRNINCFGVCFYNIERVINTESVNNIITPVSEDIESVIQELTIESLTYKRTDDETIETTNSRDNIDNYVLATIISNPQPFKIYQDMSRIMNSIVTYDEQTEEFDIELVPLISLRYYMARPKLIYDLINRFINVIDSTLPRLENNNKCDIKFYNTYGPSRYFYFSKENISKTVYKNSDTNEEIFEDDPDFNPYVNTIITDKNYSKYNYLGRTDIILDFTIYLYENISSEKDEEIKKFISDYVEEANTELILPISNLINKLQNNFPIIKFIKYNGIFSDIVDSNNPSKNNDYQLIDNDFDFNKMNKDEIRVYVPEYLNLKKDIVKIRENYSATDIFDILRYSTYDYVINIKYQV